MELWEHTPRKPGPPRPAVPPEDSGEPQEIEGSVESIIYHDEESHYTVCSVHVEGRADPVPVVGRCPSLWVGEHLKAKGKWTRHRQHGYQFQADSITCIVPTTALGMQRFLGSGMIKGIGKIMAERLVAAFGEKTLEIIEKDSGRLQEVEGIGPQRRQQIKESWIAAKGIRDVMIFLQSHGLGTGQAGRIFRAYGHHAIAMITENPYRLCADVWGIGFKTADKVAMDLGVPAQSALRARAGIVYVMDTMAEEGHCFCLESELILRATELLTIPAEILMEALQHEVENRKLIKEVDRIYPHALHAAEVRVVAQIKKLMATPTLFKPIEAAKAVPWAAERMKIQFAPMQTEALRTALTEKVSIITGGPGVGKTTIIRALVEVMKRRGLTVVLAAPTGRAAKRMSEATGQEASTIHRLLKVNPNTHRFEHGPDNPLAGSMFILDETSMVDISLMANTLGALPADACLVIVGDSDQLPSVGPGNVLRDLIASEAIPFRRLETIFRQEKGGWIVRNAHRVNSGEYIQIPPQGEDSDFYFVPADEPDDVIKKMMELVTTRIPAKFKFDVMREIQVLTPMRRNQLGADNLNGVLQEAMNPTGLELERFGRKYRVGDRVMQIRNNYDKDVFNGDIGRIKDVDVENSTLVVDFDGRLVWYDASELDEMIHAYACSIHKSQGSEFPAVVILITTQHYKLLQRNLLYTAITRGRKLVCVVGSHKALHIAIQNNEIRLRRTGLRERLIQALRPGEFTREAVVD